MHNPIVVIALAGVAAFVFGAVYYMTLGKVWQQALDINPDDCKDKPPPFKPMAICIVAEWVMAAVMYQTLTNLGTASGSLGPTLGGAIAGATLGLGFMATSTFVNNAFPGRKVSLSVIDSIHWIVVAAIEGAVIGALT